MTTPEAPGLRVLLYHTAKDVTAIESAYRRTSEALLGTRGLLGNELLHSVHDSAGFVVASGWRSISAFQAWEQGGDHRAATAPLRPFRDTGVGRPFALYRVTAAYDQNGPVPGTAPGGE